MTDFEKGFFEELQKIAYAGTGGTKAPALGGPGGIMQAKPISPQKPLATAMRSPLSLVTAMKPPKQEFFKGQ